LSINDEHLLLTSKITEEKTNNKREGEWVIKNTSTTDFHPQP